MNWRVNDTEPFSWFGNHIEFPITEFVRVILFQLKYANNSTYIAYCKMIRLIHSEAAAFGYRNGFVTIFLVDGISIYYNIVQSDN